MIHTIETGPPVESAAFYGIELHKHHFAAWAASRAASVKGCRFSVEKGRAILEDCGFVAAFSAPVHLPPCQDIDEQHRRWRISAIAAAQPGGLTFTHGVAAKLVNCYLKSRFVCGGHHADERVQNLHPPIDDLLLKALADSDTGGFARQWRKARRTRWSKLDSEGYEAVIALIRASLQGEPLWRIEEHWKGHQ